MTNTKQIYEIAILGRILWNLHSLNNEGTIGNVTEPRSVKIIDPNTNEIITTDGISGEMLKHIHTVKLWEIIGDKSKLLCEACRKLDPNKAQNNTKAKGNREKIIEIAVRDCIICDLHGFLTERGPASRESIIEFGWSVGVGKIGERVERDIHLHARQSMESAYVEEIKKAGNWEGQKCSIQECSIDESESDLYKVRNKWYCQQHSPVTQMLYHRPTRSGIYAIVSVFQPWRIGLNNATMEYVKGIDRKERYQLALEAYQAMFLRTEGAMTTTRLPHTEGFEGIIVISYQNFPVPVVSPLKDSYLNEMENINQELGGIFELKKFKNLDEFVKVINELLEKEPYEVKF